jgi:hypothetical protein
MLEQLFEDFQEQAFEESEVFLAGNKESVVDQLLHLYIIPIYSVEIELHARSKLGCAPMLGLTRIV